MNDYISRDEAINAIKSLESSMPAKDNYAKGYDVALGRVLIAVRTVPPAADVQPVKHGRWIAYGSLPANQWSCSECKGLVEVSHYCNKCYYDFCPNCGAKNGR